MPAVQFATHPKRPHQGLRPIGCPVHIADAQAVLFLNRLACVSAELPIELADMHRLVYLGEAFTKAGILRCLRLQLGRTAATWIEGCIDMLAAEEEAAQNPAPKPEDHQL